MSPFEKLTDGSEYVPSADVVAEPQADPGRGNTTKQVTVAPDMTAVVTESVIFPEKLAFAAATYGPTKGPPAPDGAEPVGTTAVVEMSVSARIRLTRPLPV